MGVVDSSFTLAHDLSGVKGSLTVRPSTKCSTRRAYIEVVRVRRALGTLNEFHIDPSLLLCAPLVQMSTHAT